MQTQDKIKNYGYIPDVQKPEDYVFGGLQLPDEVLQPSGNWTEFLPSDEFQRKNSVETQNCTAFATLNCLETLMKRKYGGVYNFSDRYVGVMSGTSLQGNSPQTVIETIRKESGLIDEDLLPFDSRINNADQYYSPKPMLPELLVKGKEWLSQFKPGHEWVFNGQVPNKQELLKEALKRSPLGVSVYAWLYENGCYVKPPGAQDNHWVELYNYEDGKYWFIFDHYDATHKKLAWNYDFEVAKRYSINKLLTPQEQDTIRLQIISLATQVIKLIQSYLSKKLGSIFK